MKEIRILHLFPKRLSLYGEYGNVSILKTVLTDAGYSVSVDEYEDGELSFESIDFVYIGSGTEDALMFANGILASHSDTIKASIEAETVLLATGNAPALFGKYISRGNETTKALDVFSYTCSIDDRIRFMGDVITDYKNLFSTPLIGFVNTSCTFEGMDTPMAAFTLNQNLGNDKKSASEGFVSDNFFATQMIGPFLVKNPAALQEICRRITGDAEFTLPNDSNAYKAYESALKELSNRV